MQLGCIDSWFWVVKETYECGIEEEVGQDENRRRKMRKQLTIAFLCFLFLVLKRLFWKLFSKNVINYGSEIDC